MEISSNLTLEIFNQPFLLEKRIELLIAIQKTGSISKAGSLQDAVNLLLHGKRES